MRRILILMALLSVLGACAAPESGSDTTASAEEGAETTAAAVTTGGGADTETTAGGDATGTTGGEGEPILIGANIEQSGGASVQGEAYANALNLLVGQINDAGGVLGRHIELRVVDNRTDQTEAAVLTSQLVEEGVVAMIGPGTSPTTLAAMEPILESGIPVFSMGSSDAIVLPVEERPNVFKTAQNGSLMAEEIVAHLGEEGITDVGFISVNNPYGDSGLDAFGTLAEEGSVTVVASEKFEGDANDMSPQLTNIMAAGPGAIVTWAIPPGAPNVRRSAVESLGVELPMYFDAGAGAELFVELAGEAADGALVIHPKTLAWDQIPEDDPQYEVLQNFGTSYTAEYGAMSGFAGYAWDALGMLVAAIEEAGSTEAEAVIAALEGQDEYVGVTGTFEVSAEDHQGLGEGDLVLLEVVDGEWVLR
ncbi:MAG: ABC transporter substrate-binding protein [Acidimicrobiia bacterium]|nr:ABC transporter substrate-binding protein [Acidimicrobiia bacterium]